MNYYAALVGTVRPYAHAIRDPKGNVVEEFPLVRITGAKNKNGTNYFTAEFYGGSKSGEPCLLGIDDIIAF